MNEKELEDQIFHFLIRFEKDTKILRKKGIINFIIRKRSIQGIIQLTKWSENISIDEEDQSEKEKNRKKKRRKTEDSRKHNNHEKDKNITQGKEKEIVIKRKDNDIWEENIKDLIKFKKSRRRWITDNEESKKIERRILKKRESKENENETQQCEKKKRWSNRKPISSIWSKWIKDTECDRNNKSAIEIWSEKDS